MALVALYISIFLAVFNFTSAIMGGAYVIGELGGSSDIACYNVTFFGLGNACSFPIARALTSRIGKAFGLKFFLVFLFFSLLLSGMASTFFLFVLIHLFSGFACGIIFPTAIELVSHKLSQEQEKKFFAFLGLLTAITPVIGASVGGWMAYDYNWRWVFYLEMPLLIFCLIALMEEKDLPIPSLPKFDKLGYFLYLVAIGSFVTAICLGEQLDWFRSVFISSLFIISIVFFGFFCLWEWNQENPFMKIRLFKNGTFCLSIFLMSTLFSAYFGMIILLSLWLRFDANYTPIWISLLLLNMLFAGLILFIFLIKWIAKAPPFAPIFFSIGSFAISCFYSSTFNVDVDFFRLAIARVLAGFGLAFFFFPLLTICLKCIPQESKAEGNAIFQTTRLLSSGLGVAVYTTIWYRRKIFYHDRLGSSLTIYQQNTTDFFSSLQDLGIKGLQADEVLEEALLKQATALGLADCFYLMGWVMLLILGVLTVYLLTQHLQKKEKHRINI